MNWELFFKIVLIAIGAMGDIVSWVWAMISLEEGKYKKAGIMGIIFALCVILCAAGIAIGS